MSKTIELHLKAKHFRNTEFLDCYNCAIAKAAKENFKTTQVREHVNKIYINDIKYSHIKYTPSNFEIDRQEAILSTDPEKIIRTILLTESANNS